MKKHNMTKPITECQHRYGEWANTSSTIEYYKAHCIDCGACLFESPCAPTQDIFKITPEILGVIKIKEKS